MDILTFLFPKRCVGCHRIGAYLCVACGTKAEVISRPICPVCQRQAIGGKTHPGCLKTYGLDGIVIGYRYRGPVKILIKKLKYEWIRDLEQTLCAMLIDNFWRYDLPQKLILVPVPLYSSRKRWRGFNQAELLTGRLSKEFKVPSQDLLLRTRQTKTQVGLSAPERKVNVRGAFEIKEKYPAMVSGHNFIVVDDVYTSGATMGECVRVLKKAGAKQVWGMALALG